MITKQTNISYTITLSPKVDNGVGPWSYDITVLYKSAYKYCFLPSVANDPEGWQNYIDYKMLQNYHRYRYY